MKIYIGFIALLYSGLAFSACPDHSTLPRGQICLDYQIPTQNTDGSTLTDLNHMDIFWGYVSGQYESQTFEVPPASGDYTLGALPLSQSFTGNLYFAMTATDDDGNESAYSNEVSRFIDPPPPTIPNAPVIAEVTVSVRIENGRLRASVTGVRQMMPGGIINEWIASGGWQLNISIQE